MNRFLPNKTQYTIHELQHSSLTKSLSQLLTYLSIPRELINCAFILPHSITRCISKVSAKGGNRRRENKFLYCVSKLLSNQRNSLTGPFVENHSFIGALFLVLERAISHNIIILVYFHVLYYTFLKEFQIKTVNNTLQYE